jgi:hypothetical protein
MAGSACKEREHFDIVYAGVFDDPDNPGTVFYFSKDTTSVVTIELPGRAISRSIRSQCPLILPSVRHVLDKITIPIVNPLDSENRVRVVQVGSCPLTTEYDLANRQTVDHDAFPCRTAPVSQPDRIEVQYFDTTSNSFVTCNSTRLLVASNSTSFNGTMTTDAFLLLGNLTTIDVATYAAQVKAELLVLALQAAEWQMNSEIELGFQKPEVVIQTYEQVVSTITSAASTLLLERSAQLANTPDTSVTDQLDAEFYETQNRTTAMSIEARARMTNLIKKTLDILDTSDRLKNLTLVENERLQQFYKAFTGGFARSLVNAMTKLSIRCFINGTLTYDCPLDSDIGAALKAIGELDPKTARCAPAGLVKLFGGTAHLSGFFSEMFGGGCSNGNLFGPIVLAVGVIMVASILLLLFLKYAVDPLKWRTQGSPGTRSTTPDQESTFLSGSELASFGFISSTTVSLVDIDRAITLLEQS